MRAGSFVVDVGSGVGQVLLQLASTPPGVRRSLGVELIGERHAAAEQMKEIVLELLEVRSLSLPFSRRQRWSVLPPDDARRAQDVGATTAAQNVAMIELRCATFTRETDEGVAINDRIAREADACFANNAHGTFDHRADIKRPGARSPNEHLASLVRRLRAGARVLSFEEIPLVNFDRGGGDAPWATLAQHESAAAAASWSAEPQPLYLYRKERDQWRCACGLDIPLCDASGEDCTAHASFDPELDWECEPIEAGRERARSLRPRGPRLI